jgi:hypothetical protein
MIWMRDVNHLSAVRLFHVLLPAVVVMGMVFGFGAEA